MNIKDPIIELTDDFEGVIPEGYELILFEKGGLPGDGYVLYVFDEVGDPEFEEDFDDPFYAFVSNEVI